MHAGGGSKSNQPSVAVVGAGMAGCEAAWYLAQAGFEVDLWEMRPAVLTPAHHSGNFAEIVCTNSFGGVALNTPAGVLKAEMRLLGSLLLEIADQVEVPAGSALAVDREAFAERVTARVKSHPRITVRTQECTSIPEGPAVVATGPLTSAALSRSIEERFGRALAFFDAAAPILSAESIDLGKVYQANRWGKGEADYLNAPLDEATYEAFWQALCTAERHPLHDFEDVRHFEGCLPVETIAERGRDTLRFGPLRPVGLPDPRSGRVPYAVVQLRQDNAAASLYNIVGFQTNLRFGEQKRVFRMIPGLESAEFVRYGVMHRNSFLCSPRVLDRTLSTLQDAQKLFAGQLVGVEGYMESAATGLVAARTVAQRLQGRAPTVPPPQSMIGALLRYITTADPDRFQPMNANFGILPELDQPVQNRRERKEQMARRALAALADYAAQTKPQEAVRL